MLLLLISVMWGRVAKIHFKIMSHTRGGGSSSALEALISKIINNLQISVSHDSEKLTAIDRFLVVMSHRRPRPLADL